LMLGVLAVGSILVAGSFMVARLEVQSAGSSMTAARAFEAAESGLSEIVAWWDPFLYDTLPVGDSVVLPGRSMGRGGYRGTVTRLTLPIYQIRAEGWYQAANSTLGRRALARWIRVALQPPPMVAAASIRDSLSLGPMSSISGLDSAGPGCPPSLGPVADTAGIADSTLLGFVGHHYPVPPASFQRVPGALTLNGGLTRGLLLVEGDLVLAGGARFHGLAVVLGALRTGPGGGSILGAVLAGSIVEDPSLPGSLLTIRYSACVLPPTNTGSALAIPLRYRSWAQSF
jgi:hypothetical protein